jgi:flagellar hook-basal body complex protein FliE
MSGAIESVAAIAQGAMPEVSHATQASTASGAFADLLKNQVADLNANVGAAETAMQALASGKPVELHAVMISLERARLSVQTFVQVRNRLVESYQDLMRMQM